ncbi:MAG TPA: hypothetical protein VF426_07665 [Marmoricola sp.]
MANKYRFVSKPDVTDAICAVIFVIIGVVVPLHQGVDGMRVVEVCALGLVLGGVTAFLPIPTIGKFIWFFGCLVIGVAAWNHVERALDAPWFIAMIFGSVLGMDLLWLRTGGTKSSPRKG